MPRFSKVPHAASSAQSYTCFSRPGNNTNQRTSWPMGQFAKTYSQMTDDQLLGFYLERDELLPEARFALLAELQKRSLTESDAVTLAQHMAAVESARKSGKNEEVGPLDAVFSSTDAEQVNPPSLEVVFGSADASEVQVVQGLLESNGFEVTIQHGGHLGGIADFGGMHLRVAAERADEARHLITESRCEAPEESDQDSDAGSPEWEVT